MMTIERRMVGDVVVLSVQGDITASRGAATQVTDAVRSAGALKLLNVTTHLNDLLVVTRLLTFFDCFEEEPAAVASFQPQAVAS